MTTSDFGRKLIESFEGLRLTAYRDIGGIWTCGFGHTANVNEKTTCTREEADRWMADDLRLAEDAVNEAVKVPLSHNQFDALVSFVFNVGGGSFKSSKLLKLLNESDYASAANQFLAWDKIDGKDSPGLLNRRTAERAVFLSV